VTILAPYLLVRAASLCSMMKLRAAILSLSFGTEGLSAKANDPLNRTAAVDASSNLFITFPPDVDVG
jgi:hypothetical protein